MTDQKLKRILKVTGLGLILLSLIWGFYIVKSPWTNHELNQDRKKINSVHQAQTVLKFYYRTQNRLPDSLDVLLDLNLDTLDPAIEKERGYYTFENALRNLRKLSSEKQLDLTYHKDSKTDYRLCSEFLHDSKKRNGNLFVWEEDAPEKWRHPKGKYCFTHGVF